MSSREGRVARQSISSTAILGIGNLTSNAFLAITSLILARLLGPENYGVFSLALAFPLILQILVGMGVGGAITRYSAFHISRGDTQTAQQMVKSGITFALLSSCAFAALTIILASFLSITFLHRLTLTPYVQLASILIVGQTAFAIVTAAFLGWGSPFEAAIWTVFQAIMKLAISVGLILWGFGIFGAIDGYSFSLLIAGAAGLSTLYFRKLRSKVSDNDRTRISVRRSAEHFAKNIEEMMRYGFPGYVGNVILNLSQQPVFTIILALIASNTAVGYYSAATAIVLGVATVTGTLPTALFPAFSTLDGMSSDTGAAFSHAVKYVSYVVMPALIFLVGSSGLVIEILYGQVYLPASYYLELLTVSFLPLAFGQAVLPSYFNGIGKTKFTMFMNIVETLATLFPAYILIILLKLGISGLLFSIIVSNIAPTVFGLYISRKYLDTRIDHFNLIRNFLTSALCLLALYVFSEFVLVGVFKIFAFIIEFLVFFGLYLTLAPFARVVEREDIERLKSASSGLRILSKLFDPILSYESLLIEISSKK